MRRAGEDVRVPVNLGQRLTPVIRGANNDEVAQTPACQRCCISKLSHSPASLFALRGSHCPQLRAEADHILRFDRKQRLPFAEEPGVFGGEMTRLLVVELRNEVIWICGCLVDGLRVSQISGRHENLPCGKAYTSPRRSTSCIREDCRSSAARRTRSRRHRFQIESAWGTHRQ